MTSGLERVREYFDKVLDWTCLEKLKLREVVIGLLTFDFVMSISLLVPSMMVHFVYTHRSGRAGFVDRKWFNHTDIFKFRRYQPWELETPIDWEEGDRKYVNYTRTILDARCSTYDHNISIPGDPGDYLKEVAGHPNRSGYNKVVDQFVRMWVAAIAMFYFSCPILLLAMWWKRQTVRLVGFYVFIQLFPMFLLIAGSNILHERTMCAVDIIYGRVPVKTYLVVFIVLVWFYEIFKFVILFLYCMEQDLAKKRKGFGIRRRLGQHRKQQVAPAPEGEAAPAAAPVAENEEGAKLKKDHSDVDIEKIMAKERRSIGASQFGLGIAREMLEIGNTTDDTDTEFGRKSVVAQNQAPKGRKGKSKK